MGAGAPALGIRSLLPPCRLRGRAAMDGPRAGPGVPVLPMLGSPFSSRRKEDLEEMAAVLEAESGEEWVVSRSWGVEGGL